MKNREAFCKNAGEFPVRSTPTSYQHRPRLRLFCTFVHFAVRGKDIWSVGPPMEWYRRENTRLKSHKVQLAHCAEREFNDPSQLQDFFLFFPRLTLCYSALELRNYIRTVLPSLPQV